VSLKFEIEKMISNSNNSRKIIGQFVLNNRKNIAALTVDEIAMETFTSKATVVRFAHALGFEGWREFINKYSDEILYEDNISQNIDVNYPFNPSDSTLNIIDQIQSLHIESVKDTVRFLDVKDLEKIVRLLKESNKIVIFASNPNNFIAKNFQRKMLSIGRHIEIAEDGEMGLMAGSLSKSDCAIVISYSGSIKSSSVNHINLFSISKTPIVAITSNSDSYLSKRANYIINMTSHERIYTKIENFSTEISIIYILNLLFSLYFQIDYEKNKQYRLNSGRLLEKERINDNLEK